MAYLDAQGLAVVEMHAYWRFNAVFATFSRLIHLKIGKHESVHFQTVYNHLAFLGNPFSYSKNVGERGKRKTC